MAIAIAWDNEAQEADLVRVDNLIQFDEGLESAVLISLFTDRRATASDIPDPINRRGWWGDTYPDINDDQIGSRLWLLDRAKTWDQALRNAEIYALESLQWMIDDGVALTVEATASIERTNILHLQIAITKPDTPAVRWIRTWEVTRLAVA
jgi:phage gp46-like protein